VRGSAQTFLSRNVSETFNK